MNYLKSLILPAENGTVLGLTRIVFYSSLLIILVNFEFTVFLKAPQELWIISGFLQNFRDFIFSPKLIKFLQILWWAAVALSAIGLFTRVMMALSFILALIILSVPVGFLNSNFQYYLPTVVLGIYAFSHAGDYFSLDAWLAKKGVKAIKFQGIQTNMVGPAL